MTAQYVTITHPSGTVETAWTDPSPPIEYNRVLTTEQFLDRFAEAELDDLFDSNVKKVKKVASIIQSINIFDLDNARVVNAMSELVTANILSSTRRDVILSDTGVAGVG